MRFDWSEYLNLAQELAATNSNSSANSIGENLSKLRELRNKADYQDTYNCQNSVKNALMLAQNIISKLNELTE